jgi:hypothetical protein
MVLVAAGYSRGLDGDAQPCFTTMFAAELIDPSTSPSSFAVSLEGSRAEHVATMLNNGKRQRKHTVDELSPFRADYYGLPRNSGGIAKTRQQRLSLRFADFVVH